MKSSLAVASLLVAAGSAGAAEAGWVHSKTDDAEFRARLVLDRDEIKSLLGNDLDGDYILVQLNIRPLYNYRLVLERDDFTLRSRRDNERSRGMSPDEIAGESVLVLGRRRACVGGVFEESQGPVIPGNPGTDNRPRRLPSTNSSIGSSLSASGSTEVSRAERRQTPLLERLAELELPIQETRAPVRGYLYFQVSAKQKKKHIRLMYDGPAGEFTMRFD